jgi:hypothetical protein
LENPDESPASVEALPILSPIPAITLMPVDAMPQLL